MIPVGTDIYFVRKQVLQKAGIDLVQELTKNMNI